MVVILLNKLNKFYYQDKCKTEIKKIIKKENTALTKNNIETLMIYQRSQVITQST